MAAGSSKKVIFAALAGNLLIAITKFGAALWTGSSAMLSEGVHSLVDTGNQGLLLYGHHRANRPPETLFCAKLPTPGIIRRIRQYIPPATKERTPARSASEGDKVPRSRFGLVWNFLTGRNGPC